VRREDVPPLLEHAAGELPQADMADAAWAGGFAIRRRRRRSTAIALAAVLVIGALAALAAGFGGGNATPTPPTTPPSLSPSTPAGFISPQGQIAGIDFWVAPPEGSERHLPERYRRMGGSSPSPSQVSYCYSTERPRASAASRCPRKISVPSVGCPMASESW
jgi:hypothetical protein